MRFLRFFLVAAACCFTVPNPIQVPRPYFLSMPAAGTPIAGHFPLRIGAEAPPRAWFKPPPSDPERTKVRVTVYLDGSPFLSEEAPLTYDWDTSAIHNGQHTLTLRWVDPIHQTEQTLKKITLLVSNESHSIAPVEANSRPVAPVGATPSTSGEANIPATPGAAPASAGSRPIGNPTLVAGAPQRRVLATLHPQRSSLTLASNAHPLAAHATALNLVGDRLCIGLPDGGLILYDCKHKQGKTLRLPQSTGKVVAIQSDSEAITWLTDPVTPPAPASSDASPVKATPALRQLFVYRPAERTLTGFYLAEANMFASTSRVAPWQSGIALFAESACGLLDPNSGEIINLESQLPPEAAESVSRFSALYLATEGADGLLVRADTHLDGEADASGNTSRLRLALWRWHDNTWTSGGVFLSAATDTWRLVPLAMTAEGVCSLENRSGLHVGLKEAPGKSTPVSLPFRAYFKTQDAQVALSDRHLWTTDGTVLYHTDLDKVTTDAFLPWNEKGLHVQAFAPEREGVWLATNRDIRHLSLNHADPKLGYAGLLKFRLGQEAATPPTPKDQQLAGLIAEWQGVPYLWGGSTKQGTDCSGFVMAVHEPLGVSLPRGTVALRDCSKGPLIHDELQYGDVLVYPGHCAIYIGDGKTAETVDKAVSYASVWYHDDVVVRRFLHASQKRSAHASP